MMRIAFFGDSLTSGVPGSSYVAVLRRRFPDDVLLNSGKANDTVVSLHRRISHLSFDDPLDIAFLWIGVNDIPRRGFWLHRALNALAGQRRAKGMDEFRVCYRATLSLLCEHAGRVIVAPPVLKGENLENHWNRRLADVADLIEGIAADFDRAEFLDLRAAFTRDLAARTISDPVPGNPFRVLADTLTLRTDAQIDRKSAERGLHLTLDGVHLNSAGARLVAGEVGAAIQDLASRA